jgi:xanthine/uracil/vitamin C permease (AzgA family)
VRSPEIAKPSLRTEAIPFAVAPGMGINVYFTFTIVFDAEGLVASDVLILVGASMFRSVAKISFTKIEEGLPAFPTIILIPLTFSITQGILWASSRTLGFT